jgi:hypothetical protein
MPQISQIGFGTNDYADLPSWEAGEQSASYGGAPPVAELSGNNVLTANFQIRDGFADGAIIRANTGEEFDGNFGGAHAKISGAYNFDVRVADVVVEGIEISAQVTNTGDTLDGLIFTNCGLSNQLFISLLSGTITMNNSIIWDNNDTYNRIVYMQSTSTLVLSACTVMGTNGAGSADYGAIYNRGTSSITINNTASYSVTAKAYAEHTGDSPTVAGNYNAGNDATMPGANSIATLGQDDFEDFANRDFRIKSTSELVGAGSGGGDIGAFVQQSAPTITNIDTDNIIEQGQTDVQINTTAFPATVTTLNDIVVGGTSDGSTITGGTSMLNQRWNGGQPLFDAPAGLTIGTTFDAHVDFTE